MQGLSDSGTHARPWYARALFRARVVAVALAVGAVAMVGLAGPATAAEDTASPSGTASPSTESIAVGYDPTMLAMAGGLAVAGTVARRLRQPSRRVADLDAYRRAFPACRAMPVDAQPEHALHERIDVQIGYGSTTPGRALTR